MTWPRRRRVGVQLGGFLAGLVTFALLTPVSSLAVSNGALALAFAEASQQPGTWSAGSGYQLAVNWGGALGARPLAVAYSAVSTPAGGTVTGPQLTNSSAQNASGGSLLLVQGSNLAVHGTTSPTHVWGVVGGPPVAIPAPSGLQSSDLVAVYINTSNPMVAPSDWTLQRHDGQGYLWTRIGSSSLTTLGAWGTGGGSAGWTYTAIAIGGGGVAAAGAGGGGTQKANAVQTGSATLQAATSPTGAPPTGSSSTVFSSQDPSGEDRCHNASLPSVDVKQDFGARGDGSTNDHQAFVNAIATGKVVKVPAGTYVLSQVNLRAEQVVVLCGAGQGTTTLIQAASPSRTAGMFSQYDYYNGGHVAYLEIQNLTLDGNSANVMRLPEGADMQNFGILTVMVRKMLIANDELRNAYHGVRLLDAGDQTNGSAGEAIIRDNWFHSMALEAAFTGGTTHDIYVAKEWPSHSIIWIDRNNMEQCGSGSGTSCTLPSQTAGQSVGGLLYDPDASANGGPPQQVFRVKDNTFRNLGMNMVGTDEPEGEIYLYQQADGAQIINNSFINSYYEAVSVFSSNNVEIGYNVVDGNGVHVPDSANYDHMQYYAINAFSRDTNFPTYVSSSGWNIHDNTVKNSTWYKIGICACFLVDSSGNGTGSNITINNNTFVNNMDGYDNTRMETIDTMNAVGVTSSGNNTASN